MGDHEHDFYLKGSTFCSKCGQSVEQTIAALKRDKRALRRLLREVRTFVDPITFAALRNRVEAEIKGAK